MLKKKMMQLLSLSMSLVISTMMVAPVVSAAATSVKQATGDGYRISPVRTDLSIAKGTSETVPLFIENVSAAPEDLQVVVDDFTARNESGAPALYIGGQNAPSHGLKVFTKLSIKKFSLQPGQSQEVKATIQIPLNASAGGYYGAVRFLPASANPSTQLSLAGSVASLILITVPGNYKEQLVLSGFNVGQGSNTSSFFTSGNSLHVATSFNNQGDIQEQPFGKIILKKGNKVLATEEINNTQPRGNVLPASTRLFSVNIPKLSSFGKYTVEGNFGYGSNGQLISAASTFYIIPEALLIILGIIVLLIVIAIVGLRPLIRSYNQRVVDKAQKGRRK